jgi:hypothetical protein
MSFHIHVGTGTKNRNDVTLSSTWHFSGMSVLEQAPVALRVARQAQMAPHAASNTRHGDPTVRAFLEATGCYVSELLRRGINWMSGESTGPLSPRCGSGWPHHSPLEAMVSMELSANVPVAGQIAVHDHLTSFAISAYFSRHFKWKLQS